MSKRNLSFKYPKRWPHFWGLEIKFELLPISVLRPHFNCNRIIRSYGGRNREGPLYCTTIKPSTREHTQYTILDNACPNVPFDDPKFKAAYPTSQQGLPTTNSLFELSAISIRGKCIKHSTSVATDTSLLAGWSAQNVFLFDCQAIPLRAKPTRSSKGIKPSS